jgi:hypothetical protein
MRLPDASPPELDLVTAWNVWGFYLGDYILEVHTRHRDLTGAREYVRRLKTFKPIHGLPMAVPANTPERGLADLWPKTVHVMSIPWRGRFSQHIDDMLDGHLRELANIGRDLIPDPIDYGDVRRLGMGHVVRLDPGPAPDDCLVWMRTGPVPYDEPHLHACLLTYATDITRLDPVLLRHRLAWDDGRTSGATLSHSLWFHHPARIDRWLLCSQSSPFAASGRGMARGLVFDPAAGTLVASVVQEGLIQRKDTRHED